MVTFFIESNEALGIFSLQINRYLEILLDIEMNLDNQYEKFRDKEDKIKRTLMHYAAELGFLDVAKTLVKKCPLLLGLRTAEQVEPEKIRRLLPAELALVADNVEMAAYLIRMMWHER